MIFFLVFKAVFYQFRVTFFWPIFYMGGLLPPAATFHAPAVLPVYSTLSQQQISSEADVRLPNAGSWPDSSCGLWWLSDDPPSPFFCSCSHKLWLVVSFEIWKRKHDRVSLSIGRVVLHCLVFTILYLLWMFLLYLASSNQPHRKNESKSALALIRETVKENDEPERMPAPPAVKGGCNHIYITAACFMVTPINRFQHKLDKLIDVRLSVFPAKVNVVVVSGLFWLCDVELLFDLNYKRHLHLLQAEESL